MIVQLQRTTGHRNVMLELHPFSENAELEECFDGNPRVPGMFRVCLIADAPTDLFPSVLYVGSSLDAPNSWEPSLRSCIGCHVHIFWTQPAECTRDGLVLSIYLGGLLLVD